MSSSGALRGLLKRETEPRPGLFQDRFGRELDAGRLAVMPRGDIVLLPDRHICDQWQGS